MKSFGDRNSLLVLATWLEGEVQVVAWGPGSHLYNAVYIWQREILVGMVIRVTPGH